MPLYLYKAYAANGKLERGTLEASSQQSLLQVLHSRGFVPVETSLATTGEGKTGALGLRPSRTLSLAGWTELSREFSIYLRAGLPMDHCLRLLAGNARSAAARRLGNQLLDSTLSGATLSSAIEKHAPDAPAIIVTLLRAGERSGSVVGAMEDLAAFLSAQVRIRKELQGALAYPGVLVATALATFTIITTTLVPALMPMFEQADAEPPLVLRLIQDMSDFLSVNILVLGTVSILGLFALLFWLMTENGKFRRDWLILKLPFFGRLVRDTNIALFSKTLGTLLKNGLPLSEGLETASTVVTNRLMQHRLRPATTRLLEGRRLTDVLTETGQLTDFALRFVAVGEEASKLDEVLLNLSTILQKDVEQRLKSGIALLGPAMTIGIGIAVGALILTVMQAVLSVNELVLG